MSTYITDSKTQETKGLQPRADNLAMIMQEILTATMRLKAGRQQVTDAQTFRAQMREAVRAAQQEARTRGYADNNVNLALFAVVAFLDETILNLQNPVFASWPGRPLQDELFGGHLAGETFFKNLTRLVSQNDSPELADVMEVYQLCMLLGYRGRYSSSPQGEMNALLDSVRDKIRRVRGTSTHLSPDWAPPRNEVVVSQIDPWVRPLLYATVASLLIAVILLFVYNLSLSSGIDELRALNEQISK